MLRKSIFSPKSSFFSPSLESLRLPAIRMFFPLTSISASPASISRRLFLKLVTMLSMGSSNSTEKYQLLNLISLCIMYSESEVYSQIFRNLREIPLLLIHFCAVSFR